MSDAPVLSKTARKRQMLALQELGAELVELSAERLASMALPDNLYDAVIAAQGITGFEARRRQLQYIGKLMRHTDPEPIRRQLDAWNVAARTHKIEMHRIEDWRERLLADGAALNALVSEYPSADLQQLRALIRNALRERMEDKPPRSYRALFRVLQKIVTGQA